MAKKSTIPKTTSEGSASIPERLKLLDGTQAFAVLAIDDAGRPGTNWLPYSYVSTLIWKSSFSLQRQPLFPSPSGSACM